MEALCIQPWEKEEVTMKERELEKRGEQQQEEEEGGMEASSPACSTTDEDTDEDSEPEPSPVIRRRVSFADAFGLDLVSVKEFDNVEVKDPEEREATRPLEDFYMTCLFTVPSTPEELDQRLQAQMVELESIELLRGTTSIRGIIRVVNLCYCKTVHARVSLDRWQSYSDLLAEYVPGSSDRKTDRFTFQYALVPPFEKGGTRVEICLRYHTSVGTFWANCKGMNYVLFCHQKGHANGREPQTQEESGGGGGGRSRRSNRSCLKASRRGSAEAKTRETSCTSPVVAHAEASDKAGGANTNREMTDGAEIQSLLRCKERKPLVDGIKSRRRATRLARVRDYLSQRSQRVLPKAHSHDSVSSHGICQPFVPAAPRGGDSAGVLHKRQRNLSNGSPRVLTYHEIPLLTLDWNVNRSHQSGTAEMDDVWTGSTEMTLTNASEEKKDDTPSVSDMWEMFCNGTDDAADKEISVCDEWQQFLNGSSGAGRSGVPESEWLQTAASVSPSNDKESKRHHAGKSRERDSQVGSDTPTASHAHVSVSCQSPSDICRTSPGNNVASNKPCVSSPTDDNASTHDASGRSATHVVTETLREFNPGAETHHASEDNVENSTECHEHATSNTCTENKASAGEEIFRPQKTEECEISQRYADEEEQREESRLNEEEDSKVTHIQDGLKGKHFSCDGIIEKQQDMNPSAQTRPIVDSEETIKVLLSEHETSRPLPSDKRNPTALEETKARWSHSHDDAQGGQREDGGPDEVIAKEDITEEEDASAELQRRPETLERSEEDGSYRDEDERVKIETLGEPMGNGVKNAPAQFKERELSADVESMMGLEKMFIEGFGDGLVKGVWEEVFNLKAQVSNRDLDAVGGGAEKLADVPDDTQDSSEKDLDDAFESGAFASTESSSLRQGLERSSAAESGEFSPNERGQPVVPSEQTHFTFLFQDPASTSAAQRAAQSNRRQIKERSVARQETAGQTEERPKPPRSPSEKSTVWWSMLYILIHVTRLLICTLFVAGFFYLVFLCDFPAFFALYVFSLGWWFYTWRRHRATTDKAMAE